MSDLPKVGLIIVGNSGVGKSFLANTILGKEKFKHECSADAVTIETEFDTVPIADTDATGKPIDKALAVIFNIPGLIENDQSAIDRNKAEIHKAFQICPTSIILFVFGSGSGGRILDQDVVAFEALDQAYKLKGESLCLVVNDLPAKRAESYDAQAIIRLQQLLHLDSIRVSFFHRIDHDDKDARTKIQRELFELMRKCTPAEHPKQKEIELKVDEIKKLKTESAQKQKEFEGKLGEYADQIKELSQQIKLEREKPPREIHHHTERIIEKGGGVCSMM